MSSFIIHAIILVISGIITVFLTAPIFKTHKKTSYFLTIFIPICFLWGSVNIFSPELLMGEIQETKFEDLPPEAQAEVQKFIDNINETKNTKQERLN